MGQDLGSDEQRAEFSWTCLLWGRNFTRSSYLLARWLFLRLLGLIFLGAFVSLWCQIEGLVGRSGILPVSAYLDTARQQLGAEAYWKLPTLCWISSSDGMLHALCALGAVLSMLLVVGVAPIPVLVLLWALYLSLTVAGQAFLSFQWDILLLETGFISIFIAPATWRPRWFDRRPPSSAGLWLLRWLLFKLIFLSGVTKLLSVDAAWWELTALNVHYETQPLPTWIGWYVHQLPAWFQKVSVMMMFVIEIVVPLLIFSPRRIRHVAGGLMIGFQLLITATGNYCFFNLLTMTLCVPLFDDRFLRRFVPKRAGAWLERLEAPVGTRWQVVLWVPAAVLLFVSGLTFCREMVRTCQNATQSGPAKHLNGPIMKRMGVGLDFFDWFVLSWAQPHVLNLTDPMNTISGYGLFRVMTMERPEIVIEGSRDRRDWAEYEFRWKAGDLSRRPRFNIPHQPRLDWQMWFAALNPQRNAYWLERLMRHLLEGSPEVLALLRSNPFPNQPPRYVRLVYYRYHFTHWSEGHDSGAWWAREKLGLLTRPISLPRDRRSDGRPAE